MKPTTKERRIARAFSEVIDALLAERGALVSSGDCSEMEIAFARVESRFFVRDDGMGFVLRTRDWLARADAALFDLRIDKANEKDEG